MDHTPVASWLPLFTDRGLARLENENRLTELCTEVGGGEILEMHGEGWLVLEVESDALVMRPEQEADLWCRPEPPPPLEPVEPTRFTRAELIDADGHLVIRPRYMKGC